MEISSYIIAEAKDLLKAGQTLNLPIQLPSAPAFYLATGNDQTVTAFTAFIHEGAEYKIGTQKAA